MYIISRSQFTSLTAFKHLKDEEYQKGILALNVFVKNLIT